MNYSLGIIIFFIAFIAWSLLLVTKHYVPWLKALFQYHPIGEWAMYSMPLEITKFQVTIQGIEGGKDITALANTYLWHNLKDGRFVSISHHDLPQKAFKRFPRFLAHQKEVQAVAKTLGISPHTIKVLLQYSIGRKKYSYEAKKVVTW